MEGNGRAVKQRFTLTGYQCNRQNIRVYEEYHPFQEVNRRSPRERGGAGDSREMDAAIALTISKTSTAAQYGKQHSGESFHL